MSTARHSIYEHVHGHEQRSLESRRARRQRSRRRLQAVRPDHPPLRLERMAMVTAVLRAYRERPTDLPADHATPLELHLPPLRCEVRELESWAATRGKREQRCGETIRQALELLRGFGHLTTLDFSVVPDDERPHLVALLALEHRWCYAAAGTTRASFKVATGRTGAR